jgi:hypothetical protein
MPKNEETTEGTATEETPDAEATFWARFDERLKAGVGSAIDEKLKEFRESSNSRTGRSTFPGFVADFMFGKATDKK